MFAIFIEHALGVVQQIYIPEGVFLRRGQLLHLHKNLLIVKSIKFFQYTEQFLGVSQTPDEHPTEVGSAY